MGQVPDFAQKAHRDVSIWADHQPSDARMSNRDPQPAFGWELKGSRRIRGGDKGIPADKVANDIGMADN